MDLGLDIFSTSQVSAEKTNTESIYLMSNDKYSNINQMSNFPAAAEQGIGTGTDKFIDNITNIDFNYDYSQVPMNYGDSKSFWEELAETPKEVGGYVWDTATGTWENVKLGVTSIGDKLGNVVDSAGQSVTSFYDGVMDRLKSNLLFVIALLLIVLWVVAKSGILKDVIGILAVVK